MLTYKETVEITRKMVHNDVDACDNLDTLDLMHKLLVMEKRQEPVVRAGGGFRPPWAEQCRRVAK